MKKLFTLLLFAFTVSSAMADTELSVTEWQINDAASCSHAEGTNTIVFAADKAWNGGCQLHASNSTSMAGKYLWIEFVKPTTAKYKIELQYNYNEGWGYSKDIYPEAATRYVCFDISTLAIEGSAYINIQSATNDASELEIAHIFVGEHEPIYLYLDEALNYGWNSEYNTTDHQISFTTTGWPARGWEFATAKDASGYNVLYCNLTASAECNGLLKVVYGDDTESQASFAGGDTKIYLVLNEGKTVKRVLFTTENPSTVTLNDVRFSYESVEKDLSTTGYASFSAPYPVRFPEGVAVGIAKVDGNRIVVKYDLSTEGGENTVIPANTGVILRGTGSCTLLPTTEEGIEWHFNEGQGNELVATSKYPKPNTSDGNYYYGLLADEAAFAKITGNPTFSGNKAYIKTSTQAQQARLVIFDEETTAVKGIETEATAMGKHLENGRLVIVKNGSKFNAAGQLVK